MAKSKILVTAAGSIGERHIRNLWQLGFRDILVFRTRNLPFRDLGDANVTVVLDWQEALNAGADAAFVTSPTHLHMQQTLDCLNAGMHVFVEKPIAHHLEQETELYRTLEKSKKVLQVGYMLEFHPFLMEMKRVCQNETLGKLISAECYWGDYLPNWHPWEDYKTGYAAKGEMGGGVALTLSHEIDTALWLVGKTPSKTITIKNKLSALPMDADNLTEVVMQFENEASARVHVNYVEKKAKRYNTLLFENGRLTFHYFEDTLRIEDFEKETSETKTLPNFDRNDLFMSETECFFERIKNNDIQDMEGLKRAFEVVKICTGNE